MNLQFTMQHQGEGHAHKPKPMPKPIPMPMPMPKPIPVPKPMSMWLSVPLSGPICSNAGTNTHTTPSTTAKTGSSPNINDKFKTLCILQCIQKLVLKFKRWEYFIIYDFSRKAYLGIAHNSTFTDSRT